MLCLRKTETQQPKGWEGNRSHTAQPARKQCTYPKIQDPQATPHCASYSSILSSLPRGTLEGAQAGNKSGKGAVLPFPWTGINGGEAYPEKNKLHFTDEGPLSCSAPCLRGEAGPDVLSGEARMWPVSLQDGNQRVQAFPILAHLPLASSHSERPMRLKLRERV